MSNPGLSPEDTVFPIGGNTDAGLVTSSIVLTAIVGFLIAFLMIVLLPRFLRKDSAGWSVLLVGPCDAGKTALFLRLVKGGEEMRSTVTSMQPNEGMASLGNEKRCHVIDLPGHPRLQSFFHNHVTKAKGVVMVVDSMDFNASKDEAARHMYSLLTSPVIRGRGIPIVVACNKSDGGAKAHSVDFIRKRLEKLIYDMYMSDTGNSGLDSIGNEEEREHNILTGSGETFTFSDLAKKRKYHRPLHVSFEKISVKENDIEAVREFCRMACQ